MKVEKIDHIAIRVKNMKEACKFFSELFGMKFTELGEIKDMDARSSVEPLGVEIIEPLTPDGVTARTLERDGEGLSLLSLKVADLDEAAAEMKSRGIRQVAKMDRAGLRVAVFHPKDTYGVMIELMEYETKHPMVTA